VTAPRDPLFYCAALGTGGDVVLTGDELSHVKAQRLQPGDSLSLFDGLGQIAQGQVQSIGRREIRIVIAQRRHQPPPAPHIELYCAVPKGDRIATLLDMATQLGMSRYTPIRWAHGVVEPGARAKERWQRICLEACKQSRRLHVPEIGATVALASAVTEARASGAALLLAHPDSDRTPASLPAIASAQRIALFVGPEGGLTEGELTTLRDAGADFLNLGDAILRIETAAIALIAAVNVMRTTKKN